MPAKKLYKWPEWFAQQSFTLLVGRDYVCSQSSIIAQVRVEATRRKLYVRITDSGVGITVEVFKTRQRAIPGSTLPP
jgi:hypothetical protein